MFLYDNLKNEYKAIDWGGAAASRDVLTTKPSAGWFLFPAPKPGATSFRFYDLDNKFYVDDIVLLQKTEYKGADSPARMLLPPLS